MIPQRFAFAAVALIIAAAGLVSYRHYYARYYHTAATLGTHSNDEYQRRLQRSLAYDPAYGYSALLLGSMELRKGDPRAALDLTLVGLKTFRTMNGYAQLASIYERLNRATEAEQLFEKIARMHPARTETLRRLAVLQYRRGDSEALEKSVEKLLRFDFRDLNAKYLLAADADRRGERQRARTLYQRVSAEAASTTDTAPRIFTTEQLNARILALSENSK